MTDAKSIIPIIPHPIQCSVPYNAHGFNASCVSRRKERMEKRDKDPDYCDRWAKYIINGKHYCATHAKTVALDILLEQIEGESTGFAPKKEDA